MPALDLRDEKMQAILAQRAERKKLLDSQGGYDVCVHCKQTVYMLDKLTVAGKVYHRR